MQQKTQQTGFFAHELAKPRTIKIIGLGGVGGIVVRYLSVYLASLNRPQRLVCIDGDSFQSSNDSRMIFTRFGNKAEVVVENLRELFTDTQLTLLALNEYITKDNIDTLIHSGDILLLAVDNHATRKLVNDYCSSLMDVVLISGGNDGVEIDSKGRQQEGTYGNCQIYVRQNGQDQTPSLTRFHKEIANPKDKLPTDISCTELISSVPQILFTNLTTAATMLNTFWLYTCNNLCYEELSFDISRGLMRPIQLTKKK